MVKYEQAEACAILKYTKILCFKNQWKHLCYSTQFGATSFCSSEYISCYEIAF